MVLAAAPMGSDGGIGPDRAHPTYPKGCRDESCHSGGRGHDTEVRYRRKGHAGKRRLFVCSTRVVMKYDFCTTSEVTKPFKHLRRDGISWRGSSDMSVVACEGGFGANCRLLTCTEMVGGEGVGVPVHLVARSTRRKFLFTVVLTVDVVGPPPVE